MLLLPTKIYVADSPATITRLWLLGNKNYGAKNACAFPFALFRPPMAQFHTIGSRRLILEKNGRKSRHPPPRRAANLFGQKSGAKPEF